MIFFEKKKKLKKRRKARKKEQNFWLVLRDQGWGALLKKKKKRVSKKNKQFDFKLQILMFFVLCMIFCVLFFACFFVYAKATLPDLSKAIYVERSRGVKILAEDGREITSYGALFSKPVKIDELPIYVHQAFVDTEDRRFYKHGGFDYIGFVRAMGVNVLHLSYRQGASTITQQVAKNLFLTREKSIKRKLQEFILAKRLERDFSKKQILEIYLNRVFFGFGAYGLNAASKRYFNKEAKDLNLKEVAILAGSLKAPSKYNYFSNKELSLGRAEVVLGLMKRAGTLNEAQYQEALKLEISDADEGKILGGRYFGDYVMGELSYIETDEDKDIYVKTTLNYDLQQKAEYILRKNIREYQKNNVTEGGVVILDKTGAIRAMAGGFDYGKSQFNRATQAQRQAGSAFKLFVYLAAFERGMKPSELILDEPIKIGNWEPQNYDKKFLGVVSIKDAFAKSLNAATVDLATYSSLDEIINVAHRLGISTEIRKNPAIILGSEEVKVIDMAVAYGAIFNNGMKLNPYVVDKIYDTDENILYWHEDNDDEIVLSIDVVKRAKEILREVVVNGTGRWASVVKNAHGKTGTSQNYRDAWFVGFNDKYVGAVWLGNDNNEGMNKISGGNLPTKIWAEILK